MSIKKLEYKDFSWDLHEKAGHKPIVAQMELTYRCPLHCKHCYADCYNRRETIKYELSTEEIKKDSKTYRAWWNNITSAWQY